QLGRGPGGGLLHPRMTGKAQVVVRPEVDDVTAVEPCPRALRSLECPRMERGARPGQLVELLLEIVQTSLSHRSAPCSLPEEGSPCPTCPRRPLRTPRRTARA